MKLNLDHTKENLLEVFDIDTERAVVFHTKMENSINKHIQEGLDNGKSFIPSKLVEEIVKDLSDKEICFVLTNLLLESIENTFKIGLNSDIDEDLMKKIKTNHAKTNT